MVAAGITHDITTTRNSITTGWMLEPGSYRVRRANNFAPKISQGQLTHSDLDLWPTIDINDLSHGLGAEYLRSDPNRFYYTTGFGLETAFPERVTMASSSTNSETFTAYVYQDYGNYMYAGGSSVGGVRRYDPVGNAWAVSNAGPLGAATMDMRVCFNKLYVAIGDSNDMWSFDGATWTQVAGKKARCYAVWQTKLWRGNAGNIIPFDGAADGTAVAVGQVNSNVTTIVPQSGYLIIFKDDGKIYTYDGTTVADFTQNVAYTGNYQYAVSHQGWLYYGVLSNVHRLSASAGTAPSMQDVTPKKPDDVTNGWGIPVSFSYSPNFVYCLFNSPNTGFSNLLKWNGTGWHIVLISSGAGTACYYSRVSGMVWANIGGASWFTKVNTTNDTPYTLSYPTSGGPYYVYLPHMTAGLDDIDKLWRDVKIVADNLSGTVFLTLDYQIDRSGSWVNFGTATISPQQSLQFAANNGIVAKDLWLRVGFTTNSGSVTPVLKFLSVAYQPRPKSIYSISGQIIIDNNIHLKDGSGNDPNNATQLLAELMAMADFSGPTTLVGEDQISYQVIETSVGWVESVRSDSGVTFRAPVTWLQAIPNTIILTNNPSVGVDAAGTGTLVWQHPDNIFANDLALAFTYSGGQSHYLKATGFGFNVPSSATILGAQVDIACYTDGSFPTSSVNDSTFFSWGLAWTNPANADFENGFYATVDLGTTNNVNDTSKIMATTGYGFSVPGGAVIKGIKVRVLEKAVFSGGVPSDTLYTAVYPIKGGAIDNFHPKTVYLNHGTTPTWYEFGGPTDMWLNTWTPADINASNFGFGIWGLNWADAKPLTYYVDAVKVTVYYDTTDTGTAGSVVDTSVLLLKAGAAAGTSQPLVGNWPIKTTPLAQYRVHGGPTSLWGTTITPTDTNNSGFGVALVTTNTNLWAFVDHIRMSVYYNIT